MFLNTLYLNDRGSMCCVDILQSFPFRVYYTVLPKCPGLIVDAYVTPFKKVFKMRENKYPPVFATIFCFVITLNYFCFVLSSVIGGS